MKKKRRRKEKDIFELVEQRKKNILDREKTVKQKEQREKDFQEKLKDPIFAETNARKITKSERKTSQHERRATSRFAMISKITFKTFRCLGCKQVKTDPRSWIISKDKTKAVCRSCFAARRWSDFKKYNSKILEIKLFENEIRRYRYDPLILCRMRETLKLSVEQFAAIAGWSSIYQYKLESGFYETISQSKKDELCEVFRRKSFVYNTNLFSEPIIFYEVKSSLIKIVRKMMGISANEFATRAGWSRQVQYKLESGRTKKISKSDADIIQRIINQTTNNVNNSV